MSYITDITASEMIEATRLTREGRLAEATALLQRLLRSKAAPNTADYASCDTAGAPYVGPSSLLLAVDSVDGRGEREADPAASPQACRQGPSARFAGWPAGMAQKPKRRALHGLFGELKQGVSTASHRRTGPLRYRMARSSWRLRLAARPEVAPTSFISRAAIVASQCRWS